MVVGVDDNALLYNYVYAVLERISLPRNPLT